MQKDGFGTTRDELGERSEVHRAVSKMNALKHAILSLEGLVRGGQCKESSRDRSALYDGFWQELRPSGPVEEMLVDCATRTDATEVADHSWWKVRIFAKQTHFGNAGTGATSKREASQQNRGRERERGRGRGRKQGKAAPTYITPLITH